MSGPAPRRVVRKRSANGRKRMIESEITFDQFRNWRGELPRARHRRRSALHPHFQNISVLLDRNGVVRNRSHKSIVDLLPMKDLAGIECHREIEMGSADFPI